MTEVTSHCANTQRLGRISDAETRLGGPEHPSPKGIEGLSDLPDGLCKRRISWETRIVFQPETSPYEEPESLARGCVRTRSSWQWCELQCHHLPFIRLIMPIRGFRPDFCKLV